ncbi:hypothetical protein [Auritidibacter ignavus]|uniref:hypothetical protein n=1 Tax=Auritidibacter ignavus TaxID=678932 RepID=UPI0011C44BAE|nr:hypothetical protein [Auritidibacter ignavus]
MSSSTKAGTSTTTTGDGSDTTPDLDTNCTATFHTPPHKVTVACVSSQIVPTTVDGPTTNPGSVEA